MANVPAIWVITMLIVHATEVRTNVVADVVLSPQTIEAREEIENAPSGSLVALLPGNYTELCDVLIEKDLQLWGTSGAADTVLDCENNARHLRIVGQVNVSLQGISFVGGYKQNHGGCIAAEDGASVTVNQSVFRECHSDLYIGRGGAMYISNSSLLVTRSSFSMCSASYGGIIAVLSSTFTADEDVRFADGFASFGGMAHVVHGSLVMTRRISVDNCEADAEGGALSLQDSTTRLQFGVSVRGSSSFDAGVAILRGSTMELLDGVEFDGAFSWMWGGMLIVEENSYLTMQRKITMKNGETVEESGGCVFILESEMFAEGDVLFSGCFSAQHGGALFTELSHVELAEGVHFENCTSFYDGGAVCAVLGETWLRSNRASGCHAGGWGGTYVLHRAHMELHNVTVEASTSVEEGGVICLEAESSLVATGVHATHSSSRGTGGFLAAWPHTQVFLDGLEVEDATAFPDRVFDPGPLEAGSGGMISMEGDASVEIRNSVFRDCHATMGGFFFALGDRNTLLLDANVTIEHCSAEDGGAFYVDGKTRVTFSAHAVSVRECEASRHGGMAYLRGGEMELVGTVVEGCRSHLDGGAIFAGEGSAVRVSGCTLRLNRADAGRGGAVATEGAVLTVNDTWLSANSAEEGGAVSSRGGEVRVLRCTLHNNSAEAGDGGALAAAGSGTLLFENTAILDSQAAGRGGGMAIVDSVQVHMRGRVEVRGNAALAGGGVLVNGSVFEVDGTLLVADNVASAEGGGVYALSVVTLHEGVTRLVSNRAGIGGGYCGAGASARLEIGWRHALEVVNGSAALHGGGLALLRGAVVTVKPERACPDTCRLNAACQPECLTAECNFDDGACGVRFEGAGDDAVAACDRSACPVRAERSLDTCEAACVHAGCDFSEANPHCRTALDALSACPLFDAVAFHSLRQQSRVTFVQGGSAEGFGRCVDADCNANGGFCTVVDDGGRVVEQVEPGSEEVRDKGEANGTCAGKPRLPSRGFGYAEGEMEAVLALPVEELLVAHPGCGAMQLIVRGNAAGGDGGGIFDSGCDEGAENAQSCLVGGMSAASAHASVTVIDANHAGGAGGGVFTQCAALEPCAELMAAGLGLPAVPASRRVDAGPPSMLALRNNKAQGYGDALGSLPAHIAVSAVAGPYMPGRDSLALSVSLQDSRGQTVLVGASPLAYRLHIQLHAPPTEADASDPPLPSLTVPVATLPLGTAEAGAVLAACPLGHVSVGLVVSLVGGGFDAASPRQSVEVECAPCEDGFETVATATSWTCRACGASEYVVDSAAGCQPCPAGLRCHGISGVEAVLAGSEWEAQGGVYVLKHCPRGHSVLSEEGEAAGQRCVECGAGSECAEEECRECAACAAGSHKEEAGAHACMPCPVDTFSTGGALRCDSCPLHSSTLNLAGAAGLEACACADDHYAARVSGGLRCVECAFGALCDDGYCLLRDMPEERASCSDGAGLVGEWEVSASSGEYVVVRCPEGFDKVSVTAALQGCRAAGDNSTLRPHPPLDLASSPGGGGGGGMSTAAVMGVSVGGGVVVVVAAVVGVWLVRRERERSDILAELRRQRHPFNARSIRGLSVSPLARARSGDERAESLVFEMFPRHVAEAMVRGEAVAEDRSEACAVFFSDIAGFTDLSSRLEAWQVNGMLDRLFEKFDALAAQHGVYKIDTIGDCYIGVTNLVADQQDQGEDQTARMAAFSLDAMAAAAGTLIDPDDPAQGHVRIRVGFDVGPVVGHVQGKRQKKYTIFGNTVNTASRMESTGVVGRIQCTARAAEALERQQEGFEVTRRGAVEVKGRGTMETLFVDGRDETVRLPWMPLPEIAADESATAGSGGGKTEDGTEHTRASACEGNPKKRASYLGSLFGSFKSRVASGLQDNPPAPQSGTTSPLSLGPPCTRGPPVVVALEEGLGRAECEAGAGQPVEISSVVGFASSPVMGRGDDQV